MSDTIHNKTLRYQLMLEREFQGPSIYQELPNPIVRAYVLLTGE
jgi:hypothetical protein